MGQFATSECSKKQRHLRGLHVFQFLLGNWILQASHSQEYDFSTQSPTKNSTHGTSRDKSQQFLVTVLVLVISDVVRLIKIRCCSSKTNNCRAGRSRNSEQRAWRCNEVKHHLATAIGIVHVSWPSHEIPHIGINRICSSNLLELQPS